MKRKPLTPEDRAEIARMYESNADIATILRTHNISSATMYACVASKSKRRVVRRTREECVDAIVFPALRDWMHRHDESVKSLGQHCPNTNYTTLFQHITNQPDSLLLCEIEPLSRYTGIPIETLIRRDDAK